MGKKNSTSTSQVTIPPEVLARYNAVNAKAESAAATPFQKFGTQPSDFVAQMNAQQGAGISDINTKAGSYQPFMDTATTATQAGMGPAYAGINNYMSPYIQNVADTTGAMLRQSNEQAQSGALGQAVSSGAFGGDRAGIAAANLNQQNQMAYGKTMADIYNQGYTQALGASQADLGRQLQGGAQMAGLGAQSQQLGLQGAQAKIAAGTMQQQTEQAGKDAMINQFMQEKGYPFQVAQYLANIAMGTGAQSGTTTTTKQPLNIFGTPYASGGSVDGPAEGGGVAGPMSYGQEPLWSEGYVPGGVLPARDLMVAEPPSREKRGSNDDLMKLATIAMGGAKNGGTIDARHGYAGGSTVTPEDMTEVERPWKADATGVVLPLPTSGAPAPQPAATPRAPTGVATPAQPQQPAAGGVAPRPAAEDPIAFFNNKIIRQESGGRQLDRDGKPLTSSAGAVGIAQVMEGTGPEAAKLAGVEWDRNRWMYDADYNKSLGQAYFLHQYNKYGSLDKASAAYNAGPGNLERAMARAASEGGSYTDYLPAETQNYLKSTAAMGNGASGVAGGSNLSISSSGGLGGADMTASGKPYAERNMIGRFFYNKDGTLNQNSIMSVLGGLSAMTKANTSSPITALLQGVGGGMETYKELLTKAPEAVKANIENVNALQTSYMRAVQLGGYKGTIEQYAKEVGFQGGPFTGGSVGIGGQGATPGAEGRTYKGASLDPFGRGLTETIVLPNVGEVQAGQVYGYLKNLEAEMQYAQTIGMAIDPQALADVRARIAAHDGQIQTENGVFPDTTYTEAQLGEAAGVRDAAQTTEIATNINENLTAAREAVRNTDELAKALETMPSVGALSPWYAGAENIAGQLGLTADMDYATAMEISGKSIAEQARAAVAGLAGTADTRMVADLVEQSTPRGTMTPKAIEELLAIRAGAAAYNQAYHQAVADALNEDPTANVAAVQRQFTLENTPAGFIEEMRPKYRGMFVPPSAAGLGITQEEWRGMTADQRQPFSN